MRILLCLLALAFPMAGDASGIPNNLEESLERLDTLFSAEEKALILGNGEDSQINGNHIKSAKYDSYAIEKNKRMEVQFLAKPIGKENRGKVTILSSIPKKLQCLAVFEVVSDTGFALRSRPVSGIEPGKRVEIVLDAPTSQVMLTRFEIVP